MIFSPCKAQITQIDRKLPKIGEVCQKIKSSARSTLETGGKQNPDLKSLILNHLDTTFIIILPPPHYKVDCCQQGTTGTMSTIWENL